MSLMVRDFIQTGQGIPAGGIPMPTGLGSVAVRRPARIPASRFRRA